MSDDKSNPANHDAPIGALEYLDYQHRVARRQPAELNLYQLDIILASINHTCFAIKSIGEALIHQKIVTNEYSLMQLDSAMLDIEQASTYLRNISLEILGNNDRD